MTLIEIQITQIKRGFHWFSGIRFGSVLSMLWLTVGILTGYTLWVLNFFSMNIKRAIGFGVMLWLASFVLYLPTYFLPMLRINMMYGYIYFWIVLIPLVFLFAKWYFRADPPMPKKGLYLGLVAIAIAFVLDFVTMLPLLFKSVEEYTATVATLYGTWMFWVTVAEVIILCVLAGSEFDATYTKGDVDTKEEEKKA